MSLKTFHIIFIVASTLLAFGFGLWSIRSHIQGDGSDLELGLGIASLVLGLGLIWYGRYFLKKLKGIDYL
jgi:hypothetical protein